MRKLGPLLALVLAPVPLGAQAATNLSTFVTAGSGIDDVPVLVGGSLTSEMGRIGLRLGIGIDGRDAPFGGLFGEGGNEAAWGADLDLSASAGWIARPLTPLYVTAGVGLRSVSRPEVAPLTPVATIGAGYRHELASRLALEAEGRYRAAAGGPRSAAVSGAEFRVGFSVRVHGVGDRNAPRPRGPRVSTPPPAVATARARAAAPVSAQRILYDGDRYLGTRYLWGGTHPESGFDCSGFVQYVFAKQGIRLPRVSRDQATAGRAVPADIDRLRPGDLMLFASNGSWIDHVAIYAGDGWILHSSGSAGGVRYDSLEGRRGEWYRDKFVGARRVLDEAGMPLVGG